MIKKVEHLSKEQLNWIRRTVGEAFVSNELFHNWGTETERREDVLKYMTIYVDFVFQAGELYANEDMTGFIALEDSEKKPVLLQLKMLIKMLVTLKASRIRSFLDFAKQISSANARYSKQRYIATQMVCVSKEHQGQGIATELIEFAKEMADAAGVPLLFDTDMKEYAEMYQHFGCKLYNSVTADNGVTRYCLVYERKTDGA